MLHMFVVWVSFAGSAQCNCYPQDKRDSEFGLVHMHDEQNQFMSSVIYFFKHHNIQTAHLCSFGPNSIGHYSVSLHRRLKLSSPGMH